MLTSMSSLPYSEWPKLLDSLLAKPQSDLERFLRTAAHQQPDAPLILAQVAANTSLSLPVRQLAALMLKDSVISRWSLVEGAALVPAEDEQIVSTPLSASIKEQVRNILIQGLSEPERKLRNAFAMALAKSLQDDTPEQWEAMSQYFLSLVQPQPLSLPATLATMQLLGDVARDGLDAEQVIHLAEELMPLLLKIMEFSPHLELRIGVTQLLESLLELAPVLGPKYFKSLFPLCHWEEWHRVLMQSLSQSLTSLNQDLTLKWVHGVLVVILQISIHGKSRSAAWMERCLTGIIALMQQHSPLIDNSDDARHALIMNTLFEWFSRLIQVQLSPESQTLLIQQCPIWMSALHGYVQLSDESLASLIEDGLNGDEEESSSTRVSACQLFQSIQQSRHFLLNPIVLYLSQQLHPSASAVAVESTLWLMAQIQIWHQEPVLINTISQMAMTGRGAAQMRALLVLAQWLKQEQNQSVLSPQSFACQILLQSTEQGIQDAAVCLLESVKNPSNDLLNPLLNYISLVAQQRRPLVLCRAISIWSASICNEVAVSHPEIELFLQLYSAYVEDDAVLENLLILLDAMADLGKAFNALEARIIPVVMQHLQQQKQIVPMLKLLIHLVQFKQQQLQHLLEIVHLIYSLFPLAVSDPDILPFLCRFMSSVVTAHSHYLQEKDAKYLHAMAEMGAQLWLNTEQITERMIQPVSEWMLTLVQRGGDGLLEVWPGLLDALTVRLAASSLPLCLQSLILMICFMATTDHVSQLVHYLTGKRNLSLVLSVWCLQHEDFHGVKGRLSCFALSRVLLQCPQFADLFQTILVRGDLLVDPVQQRRIMTRSRAKTQPDQFSQVTFPVKAMKLLALALDEFISTSGANAAKEIVLSDSDSDDSATEENEQDTWEDVDEPEQDFFLDPNHPLLALDMTSYLREFFRQISTNSYFQQQFLQLDEETRQLLSSRVA